MKPRMLTDWFAPLFAWVLSVVIIWSAVAQPEGVYVNRKLIWFLPLLAVAWTCGFIGILRFKRKFKEEYEALGSPQLFGSPLEARHWKFTGYLFGFRFVRLGDPLVTIGFSTFIGLTSIALLWYLSIVLRA